MTDTGEPIRPATALSELQRFARWFHQDWKLVYPTFKAGAALYLSGLSADRREALSRQLRRFLEEHAGASEQDLRQHWMNLGAQAWPTKMGVRVGLEEFQQMVDAL
jgi:hypothetical protein